MTYLNVLARPVVFSKIGNFLSGGFFKSIETPSPPKIKSPKLDIPSVGSSGAGPSRVHKQFDQDFIDKKVAAFDGQMPGGGQRPLGEAPNVDTLGAPDTPAAPDLTQYQEAHRKAWQAQKDRRARDKLFAQPTAGRVDGKNVEPFSSKRLEEASDSLTKAVKKADPPRNSALVRTAVIAAPFSALGLVSAGTVNAFLKPLIDPPSADGVTKEDLKETRILETIQKHVSTVANTWSDTKGRVHPAPDELTWVLKSNEERMDVLEKMINFLETSLASDAKALGIDVSFADTGAPKNDIESRALALNSRLAVITDLFEQMSSKIEVRLGAS